MSRSRSNQTLSGRLQVLLEQCPDLVDNPEALARRLVPMLADAGIVAAEDAVDLLPTPGAGDDSVEGRILTAIGQHPDGRSQGIAPDMLARITGLARIERSPAPRGAQGCRRARDARARAARHQRSPDGRRTAALRSSRTARLKEIAAVKAMLAVGLGGLLGSMARYKLGGVILHQTPGWRFPLSTFIINILGCGLVGLLAGIAESRHELHPTVRLFLITGFCGGFTTFSAFGFETFYLFRRQEPFWAAANVMFSVLAGLAAVWLGWKMSGAR
jgi:CrcB protein